MTKTCARLRAVQSSMQKLDGRLFTTKGKKKMAGSLIPRFFFFMDFQKEKENDGSLAIMDFKTKKSELSV